MKYRTLYLFGVALLLGAAPRLTTYRGNAPHSKKLFNGKDLTGWKYVGPGNMVVEGGLMHGTGGMGWLCWVGEQFGDCTFHVICRMKNENEEQQWYTMDIALEGPRKMVQVNGGKDIVYFKDISVSYGK